MPPSGFTWVDKPRLAAMGRPDGLVESKRPPPNGIPPPTAPTEHPPRRDQVNDARLPIPHAPLPAMHPPTQPQIDLCMSAIDKALTQNMGVGVFCGAGLGRTGTMLS